MKEKLIELINKLSDEKIRLLYIAALELSK